LVARQPCNDLIAAQMIDVAKRLTVVRFEERYGFIGDRERWPKVVS